MAYVLTDQFEWSKINKHKNQNHNFRCTLNRGRIAVYLKVSSRIGLDNAHVYYKRLVKYYVHYK